MPTDRQEKVKTLFITTMAFSTELRSTRWISEVCNRICSSSWHIDEENWQSLLSRDVYYDEKKSGVWYSVPVEEQPGSQMLSSSERTYRVYCSTQFMIIFKDSQSRMLGLKFQETALRIRSGSWQSYCWIRVITIHRQKELFGSPWELRCRCSYFQCLFILKPPNPDKPAL